MADQTRPGEVLANRYLLVDLLNESRGGRFWRAHDRVLARHVAVHVIPESDERAPLLLEAARLSATVSDPRILRVLDADQRDGVCYVVNQWGAGQSLDLLLAEGPMLPRRAAWIVSEVAEMLANAHAGHVAHGRLVPENVLIDHNGTVKVIGFAVDAALHGLPAERFSTDVVDLAGLLYAAMVGKWPGISHSGLPPAPQDDGRVLRPRKVRAGIPKVLDTLCDEVICPPAADALPSDYASAAAICAALKDYVGDGEALAAAEAAQAPEPRFRTVPVPPRAAAGGARSEGPADGDPAEGDPHHDGETDSDEPRTRVQPAVADPDATQASLPDLEKTENLSWFAPREEPPPPPPPFETPAERPLYAPDQTRRPRVPQQHDATAGNGDFWPWDAGQPPPPPVPERTPERVPGRSWLRLAGALAAALLLLVALVFAYTLGRGSDSPTESGEPSASTSPTPSVVIDPVGATDFDPQGSPSSENPDLVANVLDGDPATSWRTMTYDQNFGPGGLKAGVGVVVDLGSSQEVGQVDFHFVGSPTTVKLFLSDDHPSEVPTARPTAEGSADGEELTVELPDGASGRYLLVWLTRLPQVDGFRGEIAEIAVRS